MTGFREMFKHRSEVQPDQTTSAHQVYESLIEPQGRRPQLTRANVAAAIALLGLLAIVSSSYTTLNGDHVWRQADVYSQILGFLGQRGLEPLGLFDGSPVMFDVPIYQALVAGLSMATGGEPLVVVRLVNGALWIALMWASYRVAESLAPRAGLLFVALATASPLLRHFFSVPMPDNLALALAAAGLMLTLEGRRQWAALGCFVVAALVKSPVPFVFLVFLGAWALATGFWRGRLRRLVVLYSASLAATLAAEVIRVVATPPIAAEDLETAGAFSPAWYFGTLSDRIATGTWAMAVDRVVQALPLRSNAAILLTAGLALAAFVWTFRESWRTTVAAAAGFLSGWLTFTNLYFIHNYYGIPAVLMVFLALSVILAFAIAKLPRMHAWTYWVVVAAVLLSIVYGPQNGTPRVTSFGDVTRYAMADRSEFLYASDENVGPEMGGVSATRMAKTTLSQLDEQCESLLDRYEAVIANGNSECLNSHRDEASTFVTGPGSPGLPPTSLTLWVRDR